MQLTFIAMQDWYERKISNLSVLLLIAIGSLIHSYSPTPFDAVNAFLLSGAVIVIGYLAWQKQWLGAGDVKLISACSFVIYPSWQELILLTALGAGVLGVILIYQARLVPVRAQTTIPLGVAIAISCGYMVI